MSVVQYTVFSGWLHGFSYKDSQSRYGRLLLIKTLEMLTVCRRYVNCLMQTISIYIEGCGCEGLYAGFSQ